MSRQSCDVGITEYLTTHEGFTGIIKMRYQDFVVNEIDEEGHEIHLTDFSLPKNEDTKSEPAPGNRADVLSDDDKVRLAEFINNTESDHIILETGESKEDRTKTHQAVRFLYPELETQTTDLEDGSKVIKVTRMKSNSRGRGQHDRARRPRNSLCKFVLHKQNIGTMEAVNFIAKKLRLYKANGFQYAGTKDKRGITTQLITAPVAAERLVGLNKLHSNIKVGNFSYCTKPLQLGALGGNNFSIIIRNVVGDSQSSLSDFVTKGFVNYFGLQRFGTTSIPTHTVGIAILKSDWQKVIDLILTERDDDKNDNLNEALAKFKETSDPEQALDILKYRSSIEGILLQGLRRFGKSQLLQAITTLPRNTRKMYVHAYQSYVWNKVASRKIKEFGCNPRPGDLVYVKTYKDKVTFDTEDEEPAPKKIRTEADSYVSNKESVMQISEDNLHLFSVGDIVLPLPGHDIQYPNNECQAWYKEIMEEDGLDIDQHMVHKVKDYSLPGDYRRLVIVPANVELELMRYNDFTTPLLLSDVDVLDKVDEPESVSDGKYVAAKVKFGLPPSSYATIALRELMKTDISISAQMKMNKEHGDVENPSQEQVTVE